MNEITEFTILQLKSQLESSLENNGSQSKESLKLLLQYSKMLSDYAESQPNQKAIAILNQAYKMLLPEKPPKLLRIQFQYWRLLIVTAIKLCKALEIKGQIHQGLNVLISTENITKSYNKSLEWALNVEIQYLYYHLALIWKKLQNQERTFYAANECILLIKHDLKNKAEPKQIYMITEMLQLQSSTKKSVHQQLSYFNQIHCYQTKYLGENHKETIKTIMKINQLKSEIQFEKEIEEFSKEDFQKKLPFQEVSQVDFYGEEKSFNMDQQLEQKPQQKQQFDSKEYLRQRLFNQQMQVVRNVKNSSQSKSSLKISHQSKKSLEDFKKFTDGKINVKINSRTSSSVENKFYYFLNINNLQGRTKTETTQYRTILSKNQDRLTPQGIGSQQFRCKTNKSNVSLNNSQNKQELNNEKTQKDELFKDLMTQRPKSSLAQQRLAKQLQMTTTNQVMYNKKSSQQTQLSNQKPSEKIFKKLNTIELNVKKKILNLQQPILQSEISTKKSNQAQEIVFGPQSQKSINLITSGDDHTHKRSDLDQFEYNLEKIIKIQRYFRLKLQQSHDYKLKIEKINLNKFSSGQIHEEEDKFHDKTPALRCKSKDLKLYQRSNTSSVESIKFATKKDNFLQPSVFQTKQKEHSFNSLASSKLINVKSGSNSQINEQSSESLLDFEQIFQNIDKKWSYEEYIQGQCFFFCDDQADQIMKLLRFKVKFHNENDDENICLLCELEIEKGFQSHVIILPIMLSLKNWKLYSKQKGLQFFQNLLKEFVECNFPIIPSTTRILIFKGQYFDIYLEQIIHYISVIMKNICSERKLVGIKLYYSKDVQTKLNRKMIQQYYQKQRQEQRQYYFHPLYFFMDKYDIKINKRTSSTDLNLKGLMGNETARQKLKAAENAVLFAIRAKSQIQVQPPKPPAIPLLLFEDDDAQSPQIMEVSMRDPDVNRLQLKSIINPQIRKQSIQEQQEMSRYSNLFHQKVHHQRNNSNLTPKKASESLFKKTFTIETNLLQQKILTRPQTIIQQVDGSFSSQSQKSHVSSQNQSKDQDLQPPSVSHSVSLSFQPPPSFQKKNAHNVSQSQQGNTINSAQNLLDTQQNLVANQLFDTQALEGLELIPEQENDLDQKIITIFQKDDHFTVSPQWKIKRQATIHNFEVEYFWNQHKIQKKVFQKIYNNPFNIKEILMIGTLQIDKQYFLVSVTQILKDKIDVFNQSVLNKRDLVKIQITYRLAYPQNNVWEDSVLIKFKEFIKWFVPDFEISTYIQCFGLNKNQKIQAFYYLGRYAHIKESKLKLEYYEEKKNKIKLKQLQRRDIEISRMKQIETILVRDKLDLNYIQILGLNNLYQELLRGRKIQEEKRQRKQDRLRFFLQLTDPNYLDPITQGPKYIGEDYDGESEEKTIQVPISLQMQVLKSYNTVVYLQSNKQIIKMQSTYLIWEGQNLKMWRPFQRKIWQQVKIQNKEKLINAIQCKLRDYILKQIFVKTLSLNGKKYTIKQQKQFVTNNSTQELLYQYFQLKSFSNQQFYNFLSILRTQLLQFEDCSHFWNAYFKQYKQLQHCNVPQVGDCLLEMLIFIDNFAQVLNQNLNRYVFIRINIYEKQNMKTKMQKLVLTLDDLQITSKKQYDLNNEIITQIIFDDVQNLMHKFVGYENYGFSKHPTLVIKNSKSNRTIKLVNQLPWLHNFNYDEFDVTLYPQKLQFYHPQGSHPKIICKVIRFLKFPSIFSKTHYSFYDSYDKQYSKQQQDFTVRIPCIISVEKFQEIQCFYIYIYFPQFCRRFITKLHFDDIIQDSNLRLNNQLKEQLRIHRSEKQWQSLIESFKIVINDQKKLLLFIDKFKISCVLQEVVYQKIRQIQKNQESILFIVNIEKKMESDPNQLQINYAFEKMKLQESKNFNMFLKLQWLNQHENIQSYRLPLYELMIGYFEKTKKSFNMFDYKFKLVDLIKMCQISVENIIMNFSMNKMINYNNTLDQLIPQQLTYNIHQTIKLNINLKTIQIDKSVFKLLYRGVLLKKPQILVGIYQKHHKQKLYFYIQRATDCESFIHKIRFQEIENIYPGFQKNLQINQRSIGPNIYKILKNRLIVQSYYQLN